MEKKRDGAAYVLDEIVAVEIVDMNCSVLRGHKTEAGFTCVLKGNVNPKLQFSYLM